MYLGVHWRFDGTTGGYDSDPSDAEGPSAEFTPGEDGLVVPRNYIGRVPLGLDIADAIFNSGLHPSTASLANAVDNLPLVQPMNGQERRARSILSWELRPTDCKYKPIWGNAIDYTVRLDQ